MNSTPPSSNIDTMLPEGTVADTCRAAALDFLNESKDWRQAELASWLTGRYAPLAQSARTARPPARRSSFSATSTLAW